MPALKNAKHELFAQGLFKGLSADDAYEKAGYKPHRGNASTLRANQNVRQRVSELQEKTAKKVIVTVESLTTELEEARGIAITEKQPSAAVSASMGKAKLFGLGVENKRVSGALTVMTLTPDHLKGLSEDELISLERAYPILQKLGLVAGNSDGEAGAED